MFFFGRVCCQVHGLVSECSICGSQGRFDVVPGHKSTNALRRFARPILGFIASVEYTHLPDVYLYPNARTHPGSTSQK